MWSNKYIDIPFKDGGRDSNGLDCWGLVRLIYKDEYNIHLPSFSNSYTTTEDTERLQELINQYKEGWKQVDAPREGLVVLLKTMGYGTHVGVLINNTEFLHINEGTNVTVESLLNTRWSKRVLGFYEYDTQKSAILTAMPHPLKTQQYTLPVVAGTTLKELSEWLFEKWQVSKKFAQKIIIIVNGVLIEQDKWAVYTLQEKDKIEYRALAGKGNGANLFRMIAMIAIAIAAPYIAGYILSGGASWAAATGALGMVVTAGVSIAGNLLINAIAPIRPPKAPETTDPGSAESQLIATGNGNRVTPYDAIPVVLGKMRITPPLGAVNYITYQNDRDTYLSSLLIWGYGPLVLHNYSATPGSGLKIGELAATDYTIDRIQHHNLYNGSTAIANNISNLNDIYGTDVAQDFKNLELVNNVHRFLPSHPTPLQVEAEVPSLAAGQTGYTSVQIAVHFPQGLRKIRAQGNDAGKSYALTDSANGGNYPVRVKFEYSIGGGAYNLLTSLGTGGIVEYGTSIKKDAFTITHEINFTNSPITSSIRVRLTRLDGSIGEAPAENTTEYNALSGLGGTCYIDQYSDDSNGQKYISSILADTSLTKQQCEQQEGRWDPNTGSLIEQAKDWRLCHQVNFLSFTARRLENPVKEPVDVELSKTAIRLKSSQEINGQLEGINAIVQTRGKDLVGATFTASTTTTAGSSTGGTWQDGAINNPASLFLHVLSSPANPKSIPWGEIVSGLRVDLEKINYWHGYCKAKNFTYNATIGQQRSIVDILKDICAAGRASPTLIDGKWTVTIDEPKPIVSQFFSPHNSWGFEGSKVLTKTPDGLKVSYTDEDQEYKQVEEIIYNFGYNGDGSGGKIAAKLFEQISLPGVTKKNLAIDHAKWAMAQTKLRRESYILNTDLEYIVCNRGDRVIVAHDVPLWGVGSGRIKKKFTGDRILELDEAVLLDPSKQYQIKVRNNEDPTLNIVGTFDPSNTNISIIRNIPVTDILPGREYKISSPGTTDFTLIGASSSTVNNIFIAKSAGSGTGTVQYVDNIVRATTTNPHQYYANQIVSINAGTFTNSIVAITDSGTNWFEFKTSSTDNSSLGYVEYIPGYSFYQRIKLTAPINAEAEELFLIGELNRQFTDLLVLGIEPTSNKTARINLVDYGVYTDPDPTKSYNIFTDYLNLTETQTFSTNITLAGNITAIKLTDLPAINSITSEALVAGDTQAAGGNIKYQIKVSYSNPPNLNANITHIECEYDLQGDMSGAFTKLTPIINQSSQITLTDNIVVGSTYHIRLRYVAGAGAMSGYVGQWTTVTSHTVLGKKINYNSPTSIAVVQKNKYLYLTPKTLGELQDIKGFEIRVYKDSSTSDFWNTSSLYNVGVNGEITSNNPGLLKIVRTTASDSTAIVDLSEFNRPRLNLAGVRYRIACRTIDSAGKYSINAAYNSYVLQTLQPRPYKIKLTASGFLLINIDPPTQIINGVQKFRDDFLGIRVWLDTSPVSATPSNSLLKFEGRSLEASIPIIDNIEQKHYFRYAFISLIDEDTNKDYPSAYTISNQEEFIPAGFLDVVDTVHPPPIPAVVSVVAGMSLISVTMAYTTNSDPKLTQGTDYNFSAYTPSNDPKSLYRRASSSHGSTIVYGKEISSLSANSTTVPFSDVNNMILAECEKDTVFTISADPGKVYALYFAYKNKGGLVGPPTTEPRVVQTGLDIQKFLDLLASKITEGQLYKELQKRISRIDRTDDKPINEISNVAGQYTVKIDAGGQVAGFGLSNNVSRAKYDSTGKEITGQLEDGQPFSEFGVVANRFWIGAPAEISATKPTTNLWNGRIWVDANGGGQNAGKVLGVAAYHKAYNPIIFNPITMPNDLAYWYWELRTETELERLIAGGAGGYVNMGTWSKTQAYAVKNYIFDESSGCYYICTKAYTPTKLTSISTKNPKITGGFTASGATISVGDVIYIEGTEQIPTAADTGVGDNPSLKMGPSYNKTGTYYYVISGNTSEFTLSLSRSGKPIITGIRHEVEYYKKARKVNPNFNISVDETDPKYDAKYWLDDPANSGWVGAPERDMFPFVTETTGDTAGVYMNAAFIKDASIDNAMIKNAAIDSAKISFLNADKIKAGILDADRINAGSISIKNVDIGSLRGAFNTSWTLVMPTLSTTEVTRTIDLAPGSYEIVLQGTFARLDERVGYGIDKSELAEIETTVTGTGVNASVKCIAYWRKNVPQLSTANIKIKNKLADITTQPTYTFSGGVTAEIPPGPPGPPGPPAPPSDGGGGGGGDGGGGGGGCLAYGTPILMQDGTVKNIEDLQIGDMIKSIIIEGLSTEENAWKDYFASLFSCSPTVVTVTDIRLDTFHSYYNINNNLLKITYEHPLLVRRSSEYRFIQTIELVTGDFIYNETNGWIQVTSIEFINEPLQTVSIDTEFEDVYFANGILVHNSNEKV